MEKYQISQEELDEEEEVIRAFEAGELKSIPNAQEEIRIAKIAARNFLKEKKVLNNIDIKAQDLTKIKQLANKRDMPYTKLISEILHDYATNHFKKAS